MSDDLQVKAPSLDPRAGIPQERITGDILRGHGPRRGGLEKLLKYWRPIMRLPGGFRRCIIILANHPELYPLPPLCAWLHHETTGKWPNEGNHHGTKPGRSIRRVTGAVRRARKLKELVPDEVLSDLRFARSTDSVLNKGIGFGDNQDIIEYKAGRLGRTLVSILLPGERNMFRISPSRRIAFNLLAPGGRNFGVGVGVGGPGGRRSIGGGRGFHCPPGFEFGGRFTDRKFSNCGSQLFGVPGSTKPIQETLREVGDAIEGGISDARRDRKRVGKKPGPDLTDQVQGFAKLPRNAAVIVPVGRDNTPRQDAQVVKTIDGMNDVPNADITRFVRRDGTLLTPRAPIATLAKQRKNDDLKGAAYIRKITKPEPFGEEELDLLRADVRKLTFALPGGVIVELTANGPISRAEYNKLRKQAFSRLSGPDIPDLDYARTLRQAAEALPNKLVFEVKAPEISEANDLVIVERDGAQRRVPRWVFATFLGRGAPGLPEGDAPYTLIRAASEDEKGDPTWIDTKIQTIGANWHYDDIEAWGPLNYTASSIPTGPESRVSVDFKAHVYMQNEYDPLYGLEVKKVVFDRGIARFRCAPGMVNGGQITNRAGLGCGGGARGIVGRAVRGAGKILDATGRAQAKLTGADKKPGRQGRVGRAARKPGRAAGVGERAARGAGNVLDVTGRARAKLTQGLDDDDDGPGPAARVARAAGNVLDVTGRPKKPERAGPAARVARAAGNVLDVTGRPERAGPGEGAARAAGRILDVTGRRQGEGLRGTPKERRGIVRNLGNLLDVTGRPRRDEDKRKRSQLFRAAAGRLAPEGTGTRRSRVNNMAELLNEDDPNNLSSRGDDVYRILQDEGGKARKLFAFSANMNDRKQNRRGITFDESPDGFAGRAKAYLAAHTEDFDADEFDEFVQAVDDLYRYEQVLEIPDTPQARRALALEAADGLGTDSLQNVLQRVAQPSPEVVRPPRRRGNRVAPSPEVDERNAAIDVALAEAVRQAAVRERVSPVTVSEPPEAPFVPPVAKEGKGDNAAKIGKKLLFGDPLPDEKRLVPLVGDLQDDGSFNVQSVSVGDDGAMANLEDSIAHIKDGGDLAQVPDEFLHVAIRKNAMSELAYKRSKNRGDLADQKKRFVILDTSKPRPGFAASSTGAQVYYAIDPETGEKTDQGYIFKPLETLPDGNVREVIAIHAMQQLGFGVGGVRFNGTNGGTIYHKEEHTMIVTNLAGNLVDGEILDYLDRGPDITMQQRFEHGLANGILSVTDRHGGNALIVDGPGGKEIIPIDFGRALFYDVATPSDMVDYLDEKEAGFGRLDPTMVRVLRNNPEQYRAMLEGVVDRQVASMREFLDNKEEFIDYVKGFATGKEGMGGFPAGEGVAHRLIMDDGLHNMITPTVAEHLTRLESHVRMLQDQRDDFINTLLNT